MTRTTNERPRGEWVGGETAVPGERPWAAGNAEGLRRRLVGLAHRFLWNRDDAEDAVQEALLLAERRHGQLRRTERWWPWLCRIVVRQCHLIRRQNRRRAEREVRVADELDCRAPMETAAPVDEELAELLRGLIGELPRRQQTAIVLRHLECMNYEEIARIMQASESTVRVHVKRAREALREAIGIRFPEWASRKETT